MLWYFIVKVTEALLWKLVINVLLLPWTVCALIRKPTASSPILDASIILIEAIFVVDDQTFISPWNCACRIVRKTAVSDLSITVHIYSCQKLITAHLKIRYKKLTSEMISINDSIRGKKVQNSLLATFNNAHWFIYLFRFLPYCSIVLFIPWSKQCLNYVLNCFIKTKTIILFYHRWYLVLDQTELLV